MNHIIQDVVVLQQILIPCAVHGDLVGKTPDNDGRMVVVLNNQFLHLRNGILTTGGHMIGDIGNLCPNHQTALVTQIVEELVVLIVSQTDGGRTDFTDQIHILDVMLGQQCVADAPTVLMAADTAQRILFAIEDEATLGIDLKAAAAETGGHIIDDFIAAQQLHLAAIEVRILAAVPQMDILHQESNLVSTGDVGNQLLTILIANGVAQGLAFLQTGDVGLNQNAGILAFHNGSDLQTGAAEVVQIKVGLIDADDIHISVNTAVEGKVSNLRINGVVRAVIHGHSDQGLFALLDLTGDITAPGRITAVMMHFLLAVHIQISGGICATQFDVILICFRQVRCQNLLDVVGSAAEVISAAVLTVNGIPAMGQVYSFPVSRQRSGYGCSFFGKSPVLINIQYSSQ